MALYHQVQREVDIDMDMERHENEHRSELFTVRLWREESGNGQTEWRGKVQHVRGGEVLYFRELSMLIAALLKLPQEPESPAQTD